MALPPVSGEAEVAKERAVGERNVRSLDAKSAGRRLALAHVDHGDALHLRAHPPQLAPLLVDLLAIGF